MFKHKTTLVPTALMLLSVIALPGCSSSDNKKKNPAPPPPAPIAVAKFNLTTGNLPYPADPFFFAGTTDGTLNMSKLPYRSAAMTTALNSLDGWSTSSKPWTGFSVPIDGTSINGSTVKIVKVYLNPTNKAPVDVTDAAQVAAYLPAGWPLAQGPIAGVLTYGTDYTAGVDTAVDSGGLVLSITPRKPFDFSRGPAVTGGKILNVGYIVILTNGIKAKSGQAMGPDTLYASFQAAPADCSTITDATEQQICKFTKPQFAIAQAIGVNPASMILSWSFSTQSIDDTFAVVAATTTAKQTLIVPTGKTTADVNVPGFEPLLQGKADIYVGSTVLPYALTATDQTQTLAQQNAAVNGSFWKAANPPPAPLANPAGQAFSYPSMFNPGPLVTSNVTVPILVTVPRVGAGAGFSACAGKPPGGWPVAIVQHGLGGDRTNALFMADAFADRCFIVVSMDLPLHGITATDPAAPLTAFHCFAPPHAPNPNCLPGAVERTFDVDLVNNTTGASTPDGNIDRSGAYWINLANPITSRDNLREGEVDLIQLTKSLSVDLTIPPNPAVPAGATIDTDPTRISFVAISMGAIVGGAHVHFSNDTRTAALSVPGGVLSQAAAESATYGPPINAALAKQGLVTNGTLYGQFFRDFQAVIDGGDPINHIRGAQNMHPLLLFKVLNDASVPNNSTDRLITAGGLTKITTLGDIPVAAGTGKWSFFKVGSHGTLIDPRVSLPATQEMQEQAISFSASAPDAGGPFVTVGEKSAEVLDLTP